ncbi:MAG: GNAT family N-acetyltransferase [Pseudoxanthomonas sp.]
MQSPLSDPQALSSAHEVDGFDCGEPELNDWLLRRALTNQLGGASRTFVVVDADDKVRGYYTLAAGALSHELATGNVRRNMPDPIPMILLARLAVDVRAQGIKLGGGMLQDAEERVRLIAENAGVRALLVHAMHERAAQFYQHYGFRPSPIRPLTLMLRL